MITLSTVRARATHIEFSTAQRAIRDGLSLAGLILLIATFRDGGQGFDFYAYWSVSPLDPYGITDGFGAFHYTPPLIWLAGPLRLIPWPLAYWIWFGILIAVLIWLARDWALAWLAFPPVVSELYHGNIHLLLAAALVLSMRHPAAFAFLVLSKVTPGVTAIWWLVKRDWRALVIAVGTSAVIAGLSFVLAPALWGAYVAHIAAEGTQAQNLISIPVIVRWPIAAAVVIYAAVTDRAWLLPIAVTAALPLLWVHGLAVVVAMTPLWRLSHLSKQERAARTIGDLPSDWPDG